MSRADPRTAKNSGTGWYSCSLFCTRYCRLDAILAELSWRFSLWRATDSWYLAAVDRGRHGYNVRSIQLYSFGFLCFFWTQVVHCPIPYLYYVLGALVGKVQSVCRTVAVAHDQVCFVGTVKWIQSICYSLLLKHIIVPYFGRSTLYISMRGIDSWPSRRTPVKDECMKYFNIR